MVTFLCATPFLFVFLDRISYYLYICWIDGCFFLILLYRSLFLSVTQLEPSTTPYNCWHFHKTWHKNTLYTLYHKQIFCKYHQLHMKLFCFLFHIRTEQIKKPQHINAHSPMHSQRRLFFSRILFGWSLSSSLWSTKSMRFERSLYQRESWQWLQLHRRICWQRFCLMWTG